MQETSLLIIVQYIHNKKKPNLIYSEKKGKNPDNQKKEMFQLKAIRPNQKMIMGKLLGQKLLRKKGCFASIKRKMIIISKYR